jgi:hypothetical protein
MRPPGPRMRFPQRIAISRHIVTNGVSHPRGPLKAFSALAVFDARLYIRVRRIDQPA